MNLIEDDVLVFLYILDHAKCTITDIIKAIYSIEDQSMLKRLDSRLRNRLNFMVEDEIIVKLNGYNPVRYQANPEKMFKGSGAIVFQDSDDRVLSISPGDYIAVSGPDDRITICPLPSNGLDEAAEDNSGE